MDKPKSITKVFTKYDPIIIERIMVPFLKPLTVDSFGMDYGYLIYLESKREEGLEGVTFVTYEELPT
jgi:hypothetical protein